MRSSLVCLLWIALPVARRAPAAEPARLESIETRSDEVRITLRGSWTDRLETFYLRDPPRLVVSLPGVLHSPVPETIRGGGKWVKGVRSSQFRTRPLQARIAVDLNDAVPHRLERGRGTILLRFERADALRGPTQEEGARDQAPVPPARKPRTAKHAWIPPDDPAELWLSPSTLLCALSLWLAMTGLWTALIVSILLRLRFRSTGAREAPSGLEQDVHALSQRLRGLEGRLALIEISPNPSAPSPSSARMEEELRELKAILRSMQKFLYSPHP